MFAEKNTNVIYYLAVNRHGHNFYMSGLQCCGYTCQTIQTNDNIKLLNFIIS